MDCVAIHAAGGKPRIPRSRTDFLRGGEGFQRVKWLGGRITTTMSIMVIGLLWRDVPLFFNSAAGVFHLSWFGGICCSVAFYFRTL